MRPNQGEHSRLIRIRSKGTRQCDQCQASLWVDLWVGSKIGLKTSRKHRFSADSPSARFTLSYRDIEDFLAERGLDISYEIVRRWFLKFGPKIARNLRYSRPISSDHWHLDEMVIVIRGKKHWLWRAVDNEGEVLVF